MALWIVWALTLAALMVPRAETLTWIRIAVPAAVPAALVAARAAADHDLGAGTIVAGVACAAVAALLVLQATIGEVFINGSSYGDEWRAPLKPPGPVMVGPLPLAWAAIVAGLATGPWLLLRERWVLGVIALVVGIALAAVLVRGIHVLTQRWAVFVPAGLVLHDGFALAEPMLFRRRTIDYLGPAPADSTSDDLTSGALGLALELKLDAPVDVAKATRGEPAKLEPLHALLFSPTRPGAVMRRAAERKLV